MRTIHRFPFDIHRTTAVPVQSAADVRHVAVENGQPVLYAEVLTHERGLGAQPREVRVLLAGNPIPDGTCFAGRLELCGLVFFIYL